MESTGRVMTFRELVRLIHPDTNPNITDAGGKMSTAKLYRNEPEELYKLAIRWGLMGTPQQTPPTPPQTPPQTPHRTTERRWDGGSARQRPVPPRTRWQEFPFETPRTGGHVFVLTKNRVRVQVVKTTPARVYFYYNGKRTFALRKNVTVAKEVLI